MAQSALVQTAITFATDTKWDDIPNHVQNQSKRSLLDAVGSLLAGTRTPVAKMMSDFAQEQFAGNLATILPTGKKASYVGATLANGFSGNALDIDDGHFRTKGHPGAVILASLLALAEMPGAKKSGKEFLTALVVGNELAIRAGIIRHATYTQVYHGTGSWSPIGVCGAAGSLLNLQPKVIQHAMGTAEYHAAIAPMMKGIAVMSMTKDSMGWGAMVGVSSVLMAQKGFTGIQPLFADTPDPEVVKSLGKEWYMMDLCFKPFPTCRWAQGPIEGALKIREQMIEKKVPLENITKIQIETFGYAAALRTTHPSNTEDAQYNIAYPLAAALVDGKVGPEQVLPPRIFDQQIISLCDKVSVEFDQWMDDQRNLGIRYARVKVQTDSGSMFDSGLVVPRWEKEVPPTDKELTDKFMSLVTPILGVEKAGSLGNMIWNFDNIDCALDVVSACVV